LNLERIAKVFGQLIFGCRIGQLDFFLGILVVIYSGIFFRPGFRVEVNTFAEINFACDIFTFKEVKDVFLFGTLGRVDFIVVFGVILVSSVHEVLQMLISFVEACLPVRKAILREGFF
jgi:hypothetical protein